MDERPRSRRKGGPAAGTLLIALCLAFAAGLTPLSTRASASAPAPLDAPSFKAVGSMTSARDAHTATLLGDGTVLIAGGFTGSGALSAAELFDPATGTFTMLPPMTSGRYLHTATLLPNGTVLIAGGLPAIGAPASNTAELFDPASGTFTPLSTTMASGRFGHTATLL
ncbi:MAG TPA: kelch repeat-containing protein, partial [Actinomycetota bacterium]